jgi:hypothetical protein
LRPSAAFAWSGRRFGSSSIVTARRIKETAHASEQQRPDVARAREQWVDEQPELDPERLIFIDESGLFNKMARLRG